MSYSITPVLHNYADKNEQCKIYIQVIFKRMLVRAPTYYKVRVDQFDSKLFVINHKQQGQINSNIRNDIHAIESRLFDYLRTKEPNKIELEQIVNNKAPVVAAPLFVDFIEEYLKEIKGKIKQTSIDIYDSLIPDLKAYDPKLTFDKINITWLNLYEKHQRSLGWEVNTIHKKMSKIKTLLNRAAEKDLISKRQYEFYKVPVYVQKVPTYIDEAEMQVVHGILKTIINPRIKQAGYYFLFSCYAGFRLSDMVRFNYEKSVSEDKILLVAHKNGELVSMPLHTRLAEILVYIKDHKLTIPEQEIREHVKVIMALAGIKKNIKVHSARHSFGMMLRDNDFYLSDIAKLMGITEKTAEIYARITNKKLAREIKSKLG